MKKTMTDYGNRLSIFDTLMWCYYREYIVTITGPKDSHIIWSLLQLYAQRWETGRKGCIFEGCMHKETCTKTRQYLQGILLCGYWEKNGFVVVVVVAVVVVAAIVDGFYGCCSCCCFILVGVVVAAVVDGFYCCCSCCCLFWLL